MLDVEPLIVTECDELSARDSFAGLDWGEVQRRAGATRRHRDLTWKQIAFAIVLLLVVAAPAFAFRHEVIDFFTSSPSPRRVVNEFGQMEVSSFPPAAPGVLPHRARVITTIPAGSGRATLSVAPTKDGGYCDLWTLHGLEPIAGTGPECWQKQRSGPRVLGTFSYGELTQGEGVDEVFGSVRRSDVSVRLHYADGSSSEIDYVWVTAPINAGFFFYEVPTRNHAPGRWPVSLTVSAEGHVLAAERIVDTLTDTNSVTHTDRWGVRIQTTKEAIWSRRRLWASFNTRDGSLIEFWTMPSRRGTTRKCFVANPISAGCGPAVLTGDPLQLDLISGETRGTTLLFGEVAANVHEVVLRFQDGASISRTPQDGFLLTPLPVSRYASGHRLTQAIALDRNGKHLFTQQFQPRTPGLYPCRKPHNYGYGVKRCP